MAEHPISPVSTIALKHPIASDVVDQHGLGLKWYGQFASSLQSRPAHSEQDIVYDYPQQHDCLHDCV